MEGIRLKLGDMASGEPVWPSCKALRLVSGRTSVRYRFGSPFSSKKLWFVDILSENCHFVHHFLLKH